MDSVVDLFGAVTNSVFNLGYPGIALAMIVEGLGLPFPGDAVMILYGFAAGEGRFRLLPVIACAVSGYMIGNTLGYAGSYHYGPQLGRLARRAPWFNQRKMMRTTRMIDRYGALLLVPSRFVPGARSVSAYIAGFSRMDPTPFFSFTLLGTALWCAAWVSAGYLFGENAKLLLHGLSSWFAYIAGIAALCAIAYWILRRQRPT